MCDMSPFSLTPETSTTFFVCLPYLSSPVLLSSPPFSYEPPGLPCLLPHVDVFVSTADPLKEPPLVTANVLLSVLAVDYPTDWWAR